MSDQMDGSAGVSADVAVAEAVARAVREGGHRVAGEPRRVQGMVNDELGAQSRTRRAEVDAVVLAAEESVPEDLLTGRIGVDEAVDRLHGRGLDEGVALFAIDVWRYALGMLGSNSEPPSLRNTLESSQPSVTDPMPVTSTESNATWGESGGVVEATLLPHNDSGVSEQSAQRSKSWWLIGAAVAVAVAFTVTMLNRSGKERDVATSATIAPTTTVFDRASIDFITEATDVGDVARSWSNDGTAVIGTLSFTNNTKETTAGTYYEVIPGSMASQASAIVSTPEHTVVIDTAAQERSSGEQTNAPHWQVVSYLISIEPGATGEVTYRIEEGVGVTLAMLEAWRAEQVAAAAEFAGIRNGPPSLTITTPTATVFTSHTVTIAGTTDPTATLTFEGRPVEVKADGTWTWSGDLQAGWASLSFRGTNRFGIGRSKAIRVLVEPPISLSIDGPTAVVAGSDALGNQCKYRFTPLAVDFVPTLVTWSDGDGPNGGAQASPPVRNDLRNATTYVFSGTGTYTFDVTARASDGRTVEASHTVEIFPSGAATC